MATEIVADTPAPVLLTDGDRLALCLSSAWELDKIARTIPGLVPVDDDQTHYLLKALAGRMMRLTFVLMAALDDKDVTTKELQGVVDFHETTGQG